MAESHTHALWVKATFLLPLTLLLLLYVHWRVTRRTGEWLLGGQIPLIHNGCPLCGCMNVPTWHA